MIVFVYFFAVLSASILLTALIRQYALRRNVLDIPNQRSSHVTPTPRGGGLAIVIAFYLAVAAMFLGSQIDVVTLVILLAAMPVAVIGFLDDHTPIRARWRFLVHFLAALSALLLLQGFPTLIVGAFQFDLGTMGYLIGTLFLVWWLNLFNFMDGTDGIAASEAVFVSGSLAFFFYQSDAQLAQISVCLLAASAGFMVWNWPPAKIFMGDVGSGFLGLLLGVLVLMAAWHQPGMLYVGMVLFGAFFVDSTYTLLYRISTGQRWYQAHCSHAYQNAAKRYGHLTVLVAVWLINLFWLLPIAILIFYYPVYSLLGLSIAYCPLIVLAYRFKAGSMMLTQ